MSRLMMTAALPVALFCCVQLYGCGGRRTAIPIDGGLPMELPKCEPIIKYSGNSISIHGVTIRRERYAIELGRLSLDPERVHEATQLAEILENHRIRMCEYLPMIVATFCRKELAKFVSEMVSDEFRVTQLAIIVSSDNSEALNRWIEAYTSRVLAITAIQSSPFTSVAGILLYDRSIVQPRVPGTRVDDKLLGNLNDKEKQEFLSLLFTVSPNLHAQRAAEQAKLVAVGSEALETRDEEFEAAKKRVEEYFLETMGGTRPEGLRKLTGNELLSMQKAIKVNLSRWALSVKKEKFNIPHRLLTRVASDGDYPIALEVDEVLDNEDLFGGKIS